jgi:hypothetical protein
MNDHRTHLNCCVVHDLTCSELQGRWATLPSGWALGDPEELLLERISVARRASAPLRPLVKLDADELPGVTIHREVASANVEQLCGGEDGGERMGDVLLRSSPL